MLALTGIQVNELKEFYPLPLRMAMKLNSRSIFISIVKREVVFLLPFALQLYIEKVYALLPFILELFMFMVLDFHTFDKKSLIKFYDRWLEG